MATKNIISVEEKLRALYDLQLIDSRIDEIRLLRGELPLQIQDIEDDIAAYETRITNTENEIENIYREIEKKNLGIKEAQKLKERYIKQQNEVRNNREFISLENEIEYQDLNVQGYEKDIAKLKVAISEKKELIEETLQKIEEKKALLKQKKDDLEDILKETEREEEILRKESEKFRKVLDKHLLIAYNKIRSKVRNGLAVVTVERGAAGGSFFAIPPQKQLEIRERKKIIIDEHSGRILVDTELAAEEREKMEKLIGK